MAALHTAVVGLFPLGIGLFAGFVFHARTQHPAQRAAGGHVPAHAKVVATLTGAPLQVFGRHLLRVRIQHLLDKTAVVTAPVGTCVQRQPAAVVPAVLPLQLGACTPETGRFTGGAGGEVGGPIGLQVIGLVDQHAHVAALQQAPQGQRVARAGAPDQLRGDRQGVCAVVALGVGAVGVVRTPVRADTRAMGLGAGRYTALAGAGGDLVVHIPRGAAPLQAQAANGAATV